MAPQCTCDPIVQNGNHYIQAYGTTLRDCIYSTSDIVSVWLGLVNIAIWTIATIPQMWNNFKKKSVSGLDVRFLVLWLFADAMALGGAILTAQVAVVKVTGGVFFLNDCVLLLQYGWYKAVRPRVMKHPSLHGDAEKGALLPTHPPSGSSPIIAKRGSSWTCRTLLCCCAVTAVIVAAVPLLHGPRLRVVFRKASRVLDDSVPLCDATPDVGEAARVAGIVMAWVSNMSYFFARLPQIATNYRRRSVEGLSMTMFVLGVIANICYAVSISLRVPSLNTDFWESTFPYILSIGLTTLTDTFILGQWAHYSREHQPDTRLSPALEEVDGDYATLSS